MVPLILLSVATAISSTVLWGWYAHMPELTYWVKGHNTTQPSTALSLFGLSVAYMIREKHVQSAMQIIRGGFIFLPIFIMGEQAFVALYNLPSLFNYTSITGLPGSASVGSMIAILLLVGGLLAPATQKLSGYVVTAMGFICLTGGHVLRLPWALYYSKEFDSSMGIPTATCILLIGIAAVFACPGRKVWTKDE